MGKIVLVLVLIGVVIALAGCFTGPGFTPSDAECKYRCSKCGQRALMLNSTLRSQPCPEGGLHDWRYNLP